MHLQQQLKEEQELQLYQMELTRLVLLQQTLEKEIQENDTTNINQLRGQIQELADQVQQRSDEAARAKQVQSCFLEYEALARLANSNNQSSSRKLRNEIEQVQNEIREYEKEDEKVDHILKVRTSQFQLLIQHMHDLKRSLFDEVQEEVVVDEDKGEIEEIEEKDEEVGGEEEGAVTTATTTTTSSSSSNSKKLGKDETSAMQIDNDTQSDDAGGGDDDNAATDDGLYGDLYW